jgi:hypothetical protein
MSSEASGSFDKDGESPSGSGSDSDEEKGQQPITPDEKSKKPVEQKASVSGSGSGSGSGSVGIVIPSAADQLSAVCLQNLTGVGREVVVLLKRIATSMEESSTATVQNPVQHQESKYAPRIRRPTPFYHLDTLFTAERGSKPRGPKPKSATDWDTVQGCWVDSLGNPIATR